MNKPLKKLTRKEIDIALQTVKIWARDAIETSGKDTQEISLQLGYDEKWLHIMLADYRKDVPKLEVLNSIASITKIPLTDEIRHDRLSIYTGVLRDPLLADVTLSFKGCKTAQAEMAMLIQYAFEHSGYSTKQNITAMKMRFGIGYSQAHKLHEVAEHLVVTRQRVNFIEKNLFGKLAYIFKANTPPHLAHMLDTVNNSRDRDWQSLEDEFSKQLGNTPLKEAMRFYTLGQNLKW